MRPICRRRERLRQGGEVGLSKSWLCPSVQYQGARPFSRWGISFFRELEAASNTGLHWLPSELTMC